MKVPRLTLAYFCPDGESFHVSRMQVSSDTRLHRHDFVELFWVEYGTGIHVVNGKRQPVPQGTLVTLRPEDCHRFHPLTGTTGFSIVNIAFPRTTIDFLRERYFAGTEMFFWSRTPVPFAIGLTPSQQARLQARSDHLARGPRSLLAIESFLTELLLELQTNPPPPVTAPLWLQQALEAIRDPQHFAGGTAAFARLAGRTSHHVNYALKQHYGLTATEAVNRARMEYAAAELMLSTKKIIEISFECGFQNLSHFYEIFQHHHGTTPRRYRQRQRTLLPQ